jgi:hypothetical protein
MDSSARDGSDDAAWQTRVTVDLVPDPRLSPAQQAVVSGDYGMRDGRLAIATRGCLVPYVLQRLQLDLEAPRAAPAAQQIVVANPDALRRWLFRGTGRP